MWIDDPKFDRLSDGLLPSREESFQLKQAELRSDANKLAAAMESSPLSIEVVRQIAKALRQSYWVASDFGCDIHSSQKRKTVDLLLEAFRTMPPGEAQQFVGKCMLSVAWDQPSLKKLSVSPSGKA